MDRRIRLRFTTPSLYTSCSLLLLLIVVLLLADDAAAAAAAAARVPFFPGTRSTFPRSSSVQRTTKQRQTDGIPNPLAVAIESALHHQPAATASLIPPAQAFSTGGVPLPIHHWHDAFFRRVATRLIPSSSAGQQGSRDDGPATSSLRSSTARTGNNILRDIQMSPMIQGVKSAVDNIASRGKSSSSSSSPITTASRANAVVKAPRHLNFWESMTCGAISRSVSQTLTHPANAMKTILQSDETATIKSLVQRNNLRRLTQGAGAQLILSLPQGAVNFAVLEYSRKLMGDLARRSRLFGEEINKPNDVVAACLDFVSSAASTVCCLVVSGPITVISDNIMSGNYPNLNAAVAGIASRGGVEGFYAGWRPQLAAKIPSYGVTWVFFQRLKDAHHSLFQRPLTDMENFVVGSIASGATVAIMMPLDTIKTRLVTQAARESIATTPYKGITDAAVRIVQEEGPCALYRGLAPRLASVVPMVAIQFAVYEAMKNRYLEHSKTETGNLKKAKHTE